MKALPDDLEYLGQGFNGRNAVWYTHDTGDVFRRERFADEVHTRIRHKGWYADDMCCDTMRGIVASLSHGRFIAGYLSSMNNERCYYGQLFDNEMDAARMADEHARVAAEQELDALAANRVEEDFLEAIDDNY